MFTGDLEKGRETGRGKNLGAWAAKAASCGTREGSQSCLGGNYLKRRIKSEKGELERSFTTRNRESFLFLDLDSSIRDDFPELLWLVSAFIHHLLLLT